VKQKVKTFGSDENGCTAGDLVAGALALIPIGISELFLFRNAPVFEVRVQTVFVRLDPIHERDSQATRKVFEMSDWSDLVPHENPKIYRRGPRVVFAKRVPDANDLWRKSALHVAYSRIDRAPIYVSCRG
jgi:hypothetical protein